MSKRTFKRNAKKQLIEVEIENIEGVLVPLVCDKIFTPSVTEDLEKIVYDDKLSSGQKIAEQMVFLFGGEAKDYMDNFEFDILCEVAAYAGEFIYNPSKKK
jgi:hypothetical protein